MGRYPAVRQCFTQREARVTITDYAEWIRISTGPFGQATSRNLQGAITKGAKQHIIEKKFRLAAQILPLPGKEVSWSGRAM